MKTNKKRALQGLLLPGRATLNLVRSRILFLTTIMLVINNTASAQYGAIGIPIPIGTTYTLSSAKVTGTLNLAGYLTGAYNPGASGTGADFAIHQMDDVSLTFTPTGTWGMEYTILDDKNCGSPPNQSMVHACRGVYAIEATNPGSGETYAVTGAYDDGIFFATLNASGAVTSVYRWLWIHQGVHSVKPPMITAGSATGDYYICGAFAVQSTELSYVIKYSTSANAPVWAKVYGGGNDPIISARALIESPYNSNDLMVVGRFDPDLNLSLAAKAFLLHLNAGNGAVSGFSVYGFNNGTHADDWFTSIAPAASTTGGSDGYIIGGRAYDPSGAGNHQYIDWMIKLNRSGGVIWSSLIKPYNGGFQDEIQDVFERYNPAGEFYNYEYYGVSVGDNGSVGINDTLIVWRIDDTGSHLGVYPNEFKYPIGDGIGYGPYTSQLELVGDGSKQGDGFGAWTTDVSNNELVFVKSYFNGVNGCNDVLSPITTHQGPGYIYSPTLQNQDLAQDCQTFTLTASAHTGTSGCKSYSVSAGGNRMANFTSVKQHDIGLANAFYPNPANNYIMYSFYHPSGTGSARISIRNSLGQSVHTIMHTAPTNGINELLIDLNSLSLEPGTYYLISEIEGRASAIQKLVLTK